MIHFPKRVDAIRQQAATGLEILARLEARVSAGENLKEQLQLIRNWLEDIETSYLAILSREEQTPANETLVLNAAEAILNAALAILKPIQDAVSKYPPGTKITST